ncbi:Uncharacterized protein PBTT_01645 [Plasmodiophora brassicae]|uniref:Uncharacterized protein n=1 Tax=Plasmodiophora brassicae TaxID=37360 RepID=A0A0G4IIN3_PLABS|nr:hypothetical protein PBRA_003865 [Plasmodiophora brassicae]SPQ94375.1 unnamed protein product [Plasmodiophora brassicae]
MADVGAASDVSGVRVKTRAELNAILECFDEHCVRNLRGEELTRVQRAACRDRLGRLRTRMHDAIQSHVVVQDDIPLDVEPFDEELEERVRSLREEAERLDDELQSVREAVVRELTSNLEAELQAARQSLPATSVADMPVPSPQLIPNAAQIDAVQRALATSQRLLERIASAYPIASASMSDLKTLLANHPGSLPANNVENAANENMAPGHAAPDETAGHEPARKRQKPLPPPDQLLDAAADPSRL